MPPHRGHLTRFPAALAKARNALPHEHEKRMGIVVYLRARRTHRCILLTEWL